MGYFRVKKVNRFRRTVSCMGLVAALIAVNLILPAPSLAAEELVITSGDDPAPGQLDALGLTEAEKAWVAAHPVMRLAVDPSYPPFDFIAEDGTYSGMASDYARIIGERLGIKMVVIHGLTWKQAFERFKNRTIDIIPALSQTDDRNAFMAFSREHLVFPDAIFMREGHPLIAGPPDLQGRKVAFVKSYGTTEIFKRNWPATQFHFVDTPLEALKAVSEGRVEATLRNIGVGSYLINKHKLKNLVVAAPGDWNFLDGNWGNDSIVQAGDHSTVWAGEGDDTATAIGGHNTVLGHGGSDTITVSGQHNRAEGGSGNDALAAIGNWNEIDGDAGADVIHIAGSDSKAWGGTGNDFITVSGYMNSAWGEDGDDMIVSDGDLLFIDGNWGNDTLLHMGNDSQLWAGEGNETYVFRLGEGSDAIADLGGSDALWVLGNIADWADLEITATKGDDGSFLNLMFSEGETQWGDVTIDLQHGEMVETLRLGDGSELNLQSIYDGALEVSTANLEELSASLEAVLDGADGLSETGEIVDMVFTGTDVSGDDDGEDILA